MNGLLPFVFIRHGETDWNRAGLFQGRSDIPLNELGREQARAVACEMSNFSDLRILVSPLQRAIETAKLAFPDRLDLIRVEPDLIECDFGRFEGKSIKTVMLEYGITRKELLAEILPADGEAWTSVLKRCEILLGKVNTLQRRCSCVVMVGHDAVLQGLAEVLTGRWFDSKHCQPYYFKRHNSDWEIVGTDDADA